MSSPLVSILCPVWNEENHLSAMIASVRAQAYEAWELVLVDDGSTDSTPLILAQEAANDSRVRLVGDGERLGKVRAFNRAAAHARGEIICHLGGDDLATEDALAARVAALGSFVEEKAVGFFKINAFAGDPSSGTVLPRGIHGSRSGPSTTFTARLSEEIFPIPEALPSEDLWLAAAGAGLADHVIHDRRVVCNYRWHAGNSNPRAKSFTEMSDAMHARMKFAPLLLEWGEGRLAPETAAKLREQAALEELRRKGDVLGILRADAPLADRMGQASMAHPRLWRIRQALGTRASGWRRG